MNWGSIILSVIAIVVAIFIPSRIATEQNQIALFDKKFIAYSQMVLVRSFASAIKDYSFVGEPQAVHRTRSLFCVDFETSFGYHPNIFDFENSIGKATAALRKNEMQAYMLPMLISKNEKQKNTCAEMISSIYESLFLLTVKVLAPRSENYEEINHQLKEFVTNTEVFFQKYSSKIENSLLCGK